LCFKDKIERKASGTTLRLARKINDVPYSPSPNTKIVIDVLLLLGSLPPPSCKVVEVIVADNCIRENDNHLAYPELLYSNVWVYYLLPGLSYTTAARR
jgi:hypothetical protein